MPSPVLWSVAVASLITLAESDAAPRRAVGSSRVPTLPARPWPERPEQGPLLPRMSLPRKKGSRCGGSLCSSNAESTMVRLPDVNVVSLLETDSASLLLAACAGLSLNGRGSDGAGASACAGVEERAGE